MLAAWRPSARAVRRATFVLAVAAGVLVVLLGGHGEAVAQADVSDAADGATHDAVMDRAPDAGALGEALRERVTLLERERRALRVINGGSLPEALYTTELFTVDLRDEAAVARRIEELSRQVAKPRPKSSIRDPLADGGTVDGGALEDAGLPELRRAEDTLQLDVARLRLEFLRKPAPVRAALLDAEQEARKQARERDEALVAERRSEEQRLQAEQAQRTALDEAARAEEAGARAIANERARAEGVRASLAVRRGELSKRKSELASSSSSNVTKAFELQEDARSVAPESAAADDLYDRIVDEVKRAREELSAALDARTAPLAMPRFRPEPTDPRPDLEEARKGLDRLANELGQDADALENEDRALAWDRAAYAAERAKTLNETRLSLLDRVSAEKRARTLGLGDAGREQFRREVNHLTLLTRWTWISEGPAFRRALSSLKSPASLALFLLRVFGVSFLIFVARAIATRGPSWTDALRPVVKRAVRTPVLARALLLLLSILGNLWLPLTWLGALLLLPNVIGPTAQSPFVRVPYAVLVDYALYGLAIRAAHRGIAWFIRTPMGAIAEGMSDRILRSVHLVGRFAFGLDVFLMVSAAILGRGYLYNLALRFGWLGAVPVAAVLISAWRADIVHAYLRKRPTGALADAVRRTSDHWYGFFVATLAFLVVLVGWVVAAARRFVLSFDQTRKALAYLFRRRLEREAGERPARESVALPEDVAACLRRTPVTDEPFAIDRFPELDRWESELTQWSERPEVAGAWLVVGKTGFGKTSWLNAAEQRVTMPVARIALSAHVETSGELGQLLARAIFPTEPVAPDATLADLAGRLEAGPQRVVFLDELQNLVLRSVGHLDVWTAFSELIERTARNVFWVCACGHFTYEFLRWARRGKDAFRTVLALPAWSEDEIRALLEARTKASGWDIAYDNLVTARPDHEGQRESLVSTAEEYTRLIWGYSEGAPRVAVQCWADSLVPGENKTLRVRLFARPVEGHLDLLEEAQKFVLAAVVWHENVSVHDATRSLRYSPQTCEGALLKLHEAGVLVRATDGRYRVTTEWWPAVIRYLRRKHLIET